LSVAEQIVESLGPFAAESDDLVGFIEAITAPIEPVYGVIGEEDQTFGWSVALDPDSCPVWALPWLAQFEGVTLTEDMNEAQRRAAIKAREGSARGRPETIRSRVERTLTISRRVVLRERYDGSAYLLQVRTLASETPDENLTRAAILSQKPAGIVLDYESVIDGTYGQLLTDYATYGDVPEVSYTELLLLLSE
jgi:hypothetical protein